MSKGMLLLDLPKNCGECPCSCITYEEELTCMAIYREIPEGEERPKWCPMLELDMPRMDAILRAIRDPLATHTDLIGYIDEKTKGCKDARVSENGL